MNKWIKFNLYGMIFKIKMCGYNKDDLWLKTSYRFRFENIIKYEADDVEIFTPECIDLLIKYMGKLLDNKLKKVEHLTFIEPDFEFTFIPDKRIRADSMTEKNGYIFIEKTMELRVNLWHKGITENHFSMTFEKEVIERFYKYLIQLRKKSDEKEER